MFGPINTQSSFGTNTGVYTPRMTRAATNQAVAGAQAQASPYELRKRFNRPGVSRGLATARSLVPGVMAGRAGAADAMATQPFNDMGVNAKYQLAFEQAREGESQGWGSLGQNELDFSRQMSNQRQNVGWELLRQIMGV